MAIKVWQCGGDTRLKPWVVGVALAMACVPALAQTAAPVPAGAQVLALKTLAATCANCHGTDGRAVQGSGITSLAGLERSYFLKQMADFKSGARPATVMHQISKGYSDAQIDALASYFAGLPK
jgi:cytochrome c553